MPNFIPTLDIMAALKARLQQFQIPAGQPAGVGSGALFERIDFYDSQELATALKALIVSKQRVSFVVPRGDDYENSLIGEVMLHSRRVAAFDLLIADRAWTKGGQDAVFGGDKNLGIVAMKDLVVEDLVGADLGIPGVALVPLGGNFITLTDEKAKDSPGRECWVQSFETYAGDARIGL